MAPPKKEPKDKKLSENIKRFLQKREEEEREKQRKKDEERKALMAKRDTKAKNKINKMLKVIKSANKSVLDDASNQTDTAVTLQGPEQPDEDDYGYVSQEANALYSKIMQKYVSSDSTSTSSSTSKGGKKSRPADAKSIQDTLNRVKHNINDEKEQQGQHRSRAPRTSHQSSNDKTFIEPEPPSNNTLKPIKKTPKPAPPALSFNDILKLAEKKQHEDVVVPVKSKEDTARPMTAKQKQEEEERIAFLKRQKERRKALESGKLPPPSSPSPSSQSKPDSSQKSGGSKLYSALTKPSTVNKEEKPQAKPLKSEFKEPKAPNPSSSSKIPPKKPSQPSQVVSNQQKTNLPQRPIKEESGRGGGKSSSQQGKRFNPDSMKNGQKRRIESDEEEYSDEYDSEMDDFIDDDDAPDYSSYIKEIFGYDKSK